MDERLNLTSGSKFSASVLCPGKEQLERTVPEIEEAPDEFADRGVRLHHASFADDPSGLEDEEEVELFNTARDNSTKLVNLWCADNGFAMADVQEGPRELRLWINDELTMRPIGSGQLDRHYVQGGHVLVEDLKSGWSPHLSPAEKNWQLRFYAVLAWLEYPNAQRIRVALNMPMLDRVDCCDYTVADLQQSKASILFHIWEAAQPGAIRRPGESCRYCRAVASCPEAGAYSLLPSVIARTQSITQEDIDSAVVALSPSDLRRIWEIGAITDKIHDAVKVRLKSFPDDQLAELGLERGKAKVTRNIDAVEAAFDFMNIATNIPRSALFSTMKFSNKELADVLRREVGMSAKGAPQWIKETLAQWISEKESEAPLKRIAQ